MANALLDFVTALARDPVAAARYQADPAGVLAGAGLAGVTPADVDNLMPMVADSLAMSSPGLGGFGPADGSDPNVWASAAAAVAFEAFDAAGPLAPPTPVVVAAPEPGPGLDHPGWDVPAAGWDVPADHPAPPADHLDPDPVDWGPASALEDHAGWAHPDPVDDPLTP